MKVMQYIIDKTRQGPLHMTLIDPDKQAPGKAAEIAVKAEALGTDAIMIGGSTDVTQENLDATAIAIKEAVKIPVIYFPSGAHAISGHCDALYYMSMLNSRDIRNVIGEQVAASLIVKKLGLEPISMGYIIVEPGMKVGEVGKADLIKRDEAKKACAYAMAAEFMGMSLVYLEAGSGAPQPVPPEMIGMVRKTITVPLIVGGGIRGPSEARAVRVAGANVVVTGTLVEEGDFTDRLRDVIQAIKG
jgi:phosphoglycerol geranylgeranyltransferase